MNKYSVVHLLGSFCYFNMLFILDQSTANKYKWEVFNAKMKEGDNSIEIRHQQELSIFY